MGKTEKPIQIDDGGPAFPICPHCAGTGRIFCDQDSMGGTRVGRVSPSHAEGGYAEWYQREPQPYYVVNITTDTNQ